MNPINIFTFSQAISKLPLSEAEKYFASQANIAKETNLKDYELHSLSSFVNLAYERYDVPLSSFEGFAYSYSIPQIAKEFDLLKVYDDLVLNIELKSSEVEIYKINKQLSRNSYYLQHLDRPLLLFTYVSSADKWWCFCAENQTFAPSCWSEVLPALNHECSYYLGDYNRLFHAEKFLISPFNNPDAFLKKAYYLTNQQESFETQILSSFQSNPKSFQCAKITGAAGTGKTLLLYDIAVKASAILQKPSCVIHGGTLNDGQVSLNRRQNDIRIISAKDASKPSFIQEAYGLICFDESQRIYKTQLNTLIKTAQDLKQACIFSIDSSQSLSKTEGMFENEKVIDDLSGPLNTFTLTEKIRTNEEIAAFIKAMLQLNRKSNKDYNYPIKILYADNQKIAVDIISHLESQDYKYIPFTNSTFKRSSLDYLQLAHHLNSHKVIGQEFNSVVVTIDEYFFYDENNHLQACEHPNPDYLLVRLLFQAVTRAREKLAVVIVNNPSVFQKMLFILQ